MAVMRNAGETENTHAGAAGGTHAGDAVVDRDAVLRNHAIAGRCSEIDMRRRFGTADVMRAVDVAVEEE